MDSAVIREVAAEICGVKPKARAAVLLIRRYRTGQLPAASADGLLAALAKTLDAYVAAHAGVTLESVRRALGELDQAAVRAYEGFDEKGEG